MGLQRIFLSLLLLIVGQDAGAETIEITRSYWFKEPLPWEAAFRHSTGGRGREKESIERFRFMETLRGSTRESGLPSLKCTSVTMGTKSRCSS